MREILVSLVAPRLKRRGVRIADPLPPLGVMIEVPGAALAADALALVADFFAIGTNDLTMYTLAIDRGDEQVAQLYNPLHPAVLRLIQFATEAALRARIPISVCGEIAGDPRYTAAAAGPGHPRAVDGRQFPAAREAAHPRHRSAGRHPLRADHHGPVRLRPHRRAAGRLQFPGVIPRSATLNHRGTETRRFTENKADFLTRRREGNAELSTPER